MTIDTTVTNGRFISESGISEHPISIHEGRVLDTPELEDVWRTIDASGYLVFPGLVQPAPDSGDLLPIVRRGVTTLLTQSATIPDSPMDYLQVDRSRVEHATNLDAVGHIRHGNVLIELPVQMLVTDENWWSVVGDESVQIHVTNGGEPGFPLLQFLYHRGNLSSTRIAAVTSIIPARWYGIHPAKGAFQPGSHGDLLVFDPDSPDPYHDDELPGRVIMSIQRGELLLYNGQIHAQPGTGMFLGD